MQGTTNMKLTVLGKYGPYPAAGGATSGYLVRSGKTAVLLDCGSGVLARLAQHLPLHALDAIVLSHLHFDHMADLLPLVYALGKKTINLYLPLTECPQYDLLSTCDCFNFIPVVHRREIKIGDLSMQFFAGRHPIESYATRISCDKRTLFYSGDTVFFDKLTTYAAGSDTLLLDCAQPSSAKNTPHMTLAEGAFLQKTTGARLLVTHVHPEFPPYTEAKTLRLEVVEENMTYSV